MKNAILFLASFLIAAPNVYAVASIDNDVAMAQPAPSNSIMRMPGMTPPPAHFPREIISNLSNAPNPVDTRKAGIYGQTQISYILMEGAQVEVKIFDLFGSEVRAWNFQPGENGGRQGENNFWWDGTNESGQKVSKGGYIAQVVVSAPAATVTAVRKIGVIH